MIDTGATEVELSIVMPCLNEAETLEACIRKAQGALRKNNIPGEVIVADNGSTDGSVDLAIQCGARVVHVPSKGYGNALMAGIAAARGKYVMMGDADDSYDFSDAPRFLEKLRQGFDLVQGCRLPAGGGTVSEKAMPFLHRWLGNPGFSIAARRMFSAPIHDINCGMRAFTKQWYESLEMRCTGMEFAVEMVIKTSLRKARIAEVPITLHRDGRISRRPHLRTFRDGWRTMRFFLLYSPRWLFLYPGFLLIAAGLAGYGVAMPALQFRGVTFDVNSLLFASLSLLMGYQAVLFAVFTKIFAISENLLPQDAKWDRMFRLVTLERGLVLGAVALFAGVVLLAGAVGQWSSVNFGPLPYAKTMRWVIPGVTLSALGFQTICSSFFLSILGMKRK